jgi:pimeloyl-ACP methyl ester carboxylesterase
MPLSDLRSFEFTASDGVRLAVHEMGDGLALILIHGYFSDAHTNWIKYGHAAFLADAGFRVIMPDLRAHGQSEKPHDVAAYAPDILADDQFALIAHLGLTEYALGGYSLGGRTVARMLVRGAKPNKAIISGMGLEGLINTGARSAHFRSVFDNLGHHERGSAAWMAEAFLKTSGGDPVALKLILDCFVDCSESEIAAITTPVAVICGEEDHDNGSAAELADILPYGQLVTIPGNHMSAVVKRELGAEISDFLAAN